MTIAATSATELLLGQSMHLVDATARSQDRPAALSVGGHGAALGELDVDVDVASGQVGGHEGWGLRQVEVHVDLGADVDGGLVEGEVDDVSATGAVFGEEVQVVAGDSQTLGVVGGTEADQRSVHVGECRGGRVSGGF